MNALKAFVQLRAEMTGYVEEVLDPVQAARALEVSSALYPFSGIRSTTALMSYWEKLATTRRELEKAGLKGSLRWREVIALIEQIRCLMKVATPAAGLDSGLFGQGEVDTEIVSSS